MPHLSPVSRKDFIKILHKFGFIGPYPGGNHSFMLKNKIRLILPNPHSKEVGVALLHNLLKQADINVEEWNQSK
ncbi:MAG: type II toxin-antitoxin system HicA family toxin [Candidatus Kapabacteria bacterium]|nr:type II toxin-antitoxin system HicA family toxin [Candidatus Kapabacteria bacterium]